MGNITIFYEKVISNRHILYIIYQEETSLEYEQVTLLILFKHILYNSKYWRIFLEVIQIREKICSDKNTLAT